MKNGRPSVLVTAIGTATSTAIVNELSHRGSFHLIGTDIFNSWEVVTSQDVNEFYKVPPAVGDEDLFLQHILDLCEKNDVDYYFATIDEEVANLSQHSHLFEELGVKLCIPNAEAIEVCHHKDLFLSWYEKNFPSTCIKRIETLRDAELADYPLFVKPSIGRASIGCQMINTYEDLQFYCLDKNLNQENIIQEYVEGSVVTVDVVRSSATDELKAIPRLELQRNTNGCGTAVEIFFDEDLIDLCRRIAKKMNLNGNVNMEFFSAADGYKMIEINPRFSAGTLFSCMAGADLVFDALRIANGLPLSQDEIRYGSRFAKRYEVYEMG